MIRKILFSTLFIFSITFYSHAQIVGTSAYMIGDLVEVGIDTRGFEGGPALAGSHERGFAGLGFVANPAADGWIQYDGDFFLPGAPENGFGIEVAGVNYSNNRSGYLFQIPGGIDSYSEVGDCIKVMWSGAAGGVDVDVTYSMVKTELYYSTQVILTNTTTATLTDVYYYRNFDPDNNQTIGGGFATNNTIEAQPSPACEKALVSATQAAPHPSYVGIGAIGPDYRVTYGGFANRDASNIWNGIGFTSAVGSAGAGDVAISLAHRSYTLAPGESDTIQFTIILNAADIDAAISSLYTFDYAGSSGVLDECSPVVDTAWTCAGMPTTISVDGPGVANFNWTWSPGTALSTTVGPTTDASPTVTTLYTVTGTPIAACVASTIAKDIVVDVYPSPIISITDPGPQCGDFDLSTLVVTDLAGTPGVVTEFYSVIPDSADQVVGLWPGTTMSAGDVVYVMMANPVTGCFDVEPVIIDFSGGAMAGPDDATTILCNTAGSTVDVNTLLVGADPGGYWEETTLPASGGFTPASGIFDADGVAGGVYTVHYVATALPPCTNDTAVMTITVNPAPAAGPDNAASLCNTAGTVLDLNSLLFGADAGGTWTETSGVPSGGFTPGTGVLDASGVTAGAYTFDYTVNGTAPCVTDVATLTITIEQAVTAGADNATTSCNSIGSAVDMNTLLVGADAGGTWAETSPTGSGAFTPGTGILDAGSAAAGFYTFTYTVTAVAPCPSDFATFSVTVEDELDAGPDNAASLCNTAGTTLDINTLLAGADAGGTWSETTGAPSGGFTPGTGVLDASGVAAGVYTFQYYLTAAAPCADDFATFSITIEQEVTAGPDNSATMCNTAGSTLDLNTLLAGADAGTWSETTAPPSGSFTPATGIIDASGLAAGVYTFDYDVVAIAPCLNDQSNFSITVTNLPNAGADNVSSLCNTAGTTLDLSTLLVGADPGGIWAETTGSGGFTPATGILDASGVTAGVYNFTYDILAVGPCPGDQSSFDITIEQEVNAGADDATSLCNTAGTTLDLNTMLAGADAGGVWSETTGSGSFTPGTGMFDASGLPAGTYDFVYDLTAVAPCLNDAANFAITVEQNLVAGPDNAFVSCNNPGASVDLNGLLVGADAGGVWTSTAPAGTFVGGIFDMSGVAGGPYTFNYTVTPVAPCISDVATVTVSVNEMPTMDPIADQQVCADDALLVPPFTADVAGTSFNWTNSTGTDIGFGLAGSGNIPSFTASNPSSAVLNITVDITPTSAAGCVGNSESFMISVNPKPTVTFNGDQLVGCAPLRVNFTNSSTPAGDDCMWSFSDGTTATGCGSISKTFEYAGTYDVGLTVTTAEGCSDNVVISDYINVSPVPEAFFSFSPGVVTVNNPEVDFTNSSINADSYTWNFGDGTAESTEENPTHIFPEIGNGQYDILLVAESDGGCVDSTMQTVIVQDVLIFFVPNTFTPDGDAFNQEFKPVIASGVDIYDYHFTIFNRWGEILFESYNVENGWDGTYGNRGLVDDEVYVWQIEFGETMSDKKNKYRGHVTVLK